MSVSDLADIEITLEALTLLEVETFEVLLQKEIATMRLKKMSEEAIFQVLLNDAETGGRVFGQFASGIKTQMYGAVTDASRAGENQYYEEQGLDTTLEKWIVVSKNPCQDCLSREGRIETADYWENVVGGPQSGFSVCKGNCQCRLAPVEVNAPDRVILK